MDFCIDYLCDAICGLTCRCAGDSVSKQTEQLALSYPAEKEALMRRLAPIAELERAIDEQTPIDRERLDFFFKPLLEDKARPFVGNSIAALLLHPFMRDRIAPEDWDKALLSKDSTEIMVDFVTFLVTPGDTMVTDKMAPAEFFDTVDSFCRDAEVKLRVLDAFYHYNTYTVELLGYIRAYMAAEERHLGLCARLVQELSEDMYKSREALIQRLEQRQGFTLEYEPERGDEIRFYATVIAFKSMMVLVKNFTDEEEGGRSLRGGFVSVGVLLDYVTKLKQQVASYDETATLLKALADSKRLEILHCLKESPRYSNELSKMLGLHPTTMSHHMAKLNEAGIVNCDLIAVKTYYSINNAQLLHIISCLKQLLR